MQEPRIAPQDQPTSDLMVFDTGSESLKARMALVNTAQKTIDLQYYAISDDVTSNLLIEAVIRAAQRGVTVRFLIDDISVGKVYKGLSVLDSLDNITVRIFNPITRSGQSFLSRLIVFIAQLPRATQRMHNKALIADRQRGIVGGRNLGDEYFDAHADKSFKDIDVLCEGPATVEMAESFDSYWESAHAVPVSTLYDRKIGKLYKMVFLKRLRRNWRKALRHNQNVEITYDEFLKSADVPRIAAKARFVADKPEKIDSGDKAPQSPPLDAIREAVEEASKDFLIVSPYFVPRPRGVSWLKELHGRGMNIRVITNSLASTDVVAVHTGYSPYRKDLLEAGILLFEMKPTDKKVKQRWIGKGSPSYASLHAKVYVIDAKTSIIGSLNFDPRSVSLNTEVALVIESEEIARILLDLYAKVTKEACYAVTYETEGMTWTGEDDGHKKVLHREPEASMWRRIQNILIGYLPVEKQL